MGRVSHRSFSLTVMDNKAYYVNPKIDITTKTSDDGTCDITVQPYGNQSFRQNTTAHNKVRCFLSFLQSAGFSVTPSKGHGQANPYEQHVDSHEKATEVLRETDKFLKNNSLVLN